MRQGRSETSIKTDYGGLRYIRQTWQLWVMLLPAVIYIFVFCYVPMYGIQLAFREYNFSAGITGGRFVGLQHLCHCMSYPASGRVWAGTALSSSRPCLLLTHRFMMPAG